MDGDVDSSTSSVESGGTKGTVSASRTGNVCMKDSV